MKWNQLRHRILGGWSAWVCRRPGWVLFVAFSVVAASVAITFRDLEFQSDRNALLSKDLDWNQNFEAWRASFPGGQDFYVVVDSGDADAPDRSNRFAQARALVDELGPVLRADERVELAVWGFDRARFHPRAVRLLPMPDFKSKLREMLDARLLLTSTDPQRFLASIMAAAQQPGGGVLNPDRINDGIDGLIRVLHAMGRVLDPEPGGRPDFGTMARASADAQGDRVYLTSKNGRLFFIRVTPRFEQGTLNALRGAIVSIRSRIHEVLARYPDIDAGLTGIDVVEADETDAATRDSTVASIIASVLITVMLIGAFHSWRTPLLVMVALLVGIAWTFGFLTLAVGHLQVLSVIFAVILLGLGVAFGIHLLSRIELVRHQYPDDTAGFRLAVCDSIQTVGPGVVTGAVTTSAAFCTTLLTDFQGVAEMGLIAAGGILLCLLSMFSVLPALLCIFASGRRHYRPMDDRKFHLFDPSWVMPFVRRPRTTLLVAGLLTGVSLMVATGMRFDYDLTHLYPRGVDSVRWQQRITQDGGQSIWAAVSVVPTLEDARLRKARLLDQEMVAQVNGIGLLFPADEARKIKRVGEVRQQLGDALAVALDRPAEPVTDQHGQKLINQLLAMRLAMGIAVGREIPPAIRLRLDELQQAIDRVIGVHGQLTPVQRAERHSRLVEEYRQWRRRTARGIQSALDPSPLTRSDVPGELLRPYIANQGPYQGSVALEIHPKIPEGSGVTGPLDPVFLPKFVGMLERIDSKITGVIVQIYHSGHLILYSYQLAGVYALGVVFLLVCLDFYSLRIAGLSLVPVAVGFAITFGVLWLLDMRVNPANIIVLPLMFGIGVDSGVHMIHRYLQEPEALPCGLTGGTGKGITITSLTTMIGFGSMVFARHRGIASLGFVMMVGIGLTMLACWAVMPAWLVLRGGGKASTDGGV